VGRLQVICSVSASACRPACRDLACLVSPMPLLTGRFPRGDRTCRRSSPDRRGGRSPTQPSPCVFRCQFSLLRQRDISRAIPVLERCLELCEFIICPLVSPRPPRPWAVRMSLLAVSPKALPLLEEAEQRGAAMGTTGGQSLRVGYVSEAYLLAGRMQDAVQLAGVPSTSPVPIRSGTPRLALRLLGEIATRQNPLEIEPAAHHTGRPSLWPRNSTCARSWPTPPRSGHAICQTGQHSRPALSCPLHRDVSRMDRPSGSRRRRWRGAVQEAVVVSWRREPDGPSAFLGVRLLRTAEAVVLFSPVTPCGML